MHVRDENVLDVLLFPNFVILSFLGNPFIVATILGSVIFYYSGTDGKFIETELLESISSKYQRRL